MSPLNRRRFISKTATGLGTALAVGACTRQEPAPAAAVANTPTAPAANADGSVPGVPVWFSMPTDTRRRQGPLQPPNTFRLRIVIRGLVAYVKNRGSMDVLLMAADDHLGRLFIPKDRTTGGDLVGDYRSFDMRGSIFTIEPNQGGAGKPLVVATASEDNPWASFKWHLNLKRATNNARFPTQQELEMGVGGAVAGILRLTTGYIESIRPSVLWGNISTWKIADGWRQHLTDTALYILDMPSSVTEVTIRRRGMNGAPDGAPIVITKPPADPNEPEYQLALSFLHDVDPETQPVPRPPRPDPRPTNLPHNAVFYRLFGMQTGPIPEEDAFWYEGDVPDQYRSKYVGVNYGDPLCNGAYYDPDWTP